MKLYYIDLINHRDKLFKAENHDAALIKARELIPATFTYPDSTLRSRLCVYHYMNTFGTWRSVFNGETSFRDFGTEI